MLVLLSQAREGYMLQYVQIVANLLVCFSEPQKVPAYVVIWQKCVKGVVYFTPLAH